MNMNEKLSRIFTNGYDILPPREFIGATFFSTQGGRKTHLEVVDIRDEHRGRDVIAIVRNTQTGTVNHPFFPRHAVFRDAEWDDEMLDARIDDALAQISVNEEILAGRAADARNALETAQAISTLARLAFVEPQDLKDNPSWQVLMALDVVFEDIRVHDRKSASFIAGQIEKAKLCNCSISLSIRQADWLLDVARRCVRRHPKLQPT